MNLIQKLICFFRLCTYGYPNEEREKIICPFCFRTISDFKKPDWEKADQKVKELIYYLATNDFSPDERMVLFLRTTFSLAEKEVGKESALLVLETELNKLRGKNE